MSTTAIQTAMNIWTVSDKSQKLSLMRRFLEKHGELTSKNDFIGFLVEAHREAHGAGIGKSDNTETQKQNQAPR